jgi:mannose-6-phosphate isomerase-like protein (cupin superfamily)
MKKDFQYATENNRPLLLRQYFPTDITWQQVLEFAYNQASVDDNDESENEIKKRHGGGVRIHGKLFINDPLWIKPLHSKVWNISSQLKDFLVKINNDFNSDKNFENCNYYNHWDKLECDCGSYWHSDGIIISLAPRIVPTHHDVNDSCYLQIIGRSYWDINGEEYILEPGDAVLVASELTHKVWGEGPRVGLLIQNNIKNERF